MACAACGGVSSSGYLLFLIIRCCVVVVVSNSVLAVCHSVRSFHIKLSLIIYIIFNFFILYFIVALVVILREKTIEFFLVVKS